MITLPFGQDAALLVIRVILGVVMMYYGWPKIKDLKSNAEDFVHMGFRPGWFWGAIVALVEFVGGLMILLGVYAGVAATLLVIHMATGTIWKITKTDKPFTNWSYDLLILAVALALLVTGSGAYHLLS